MRILVAAASRHGSTAQIAARIGERLRSGGHVVSVRDISERSQESSIDDIEAYDVFVIGSAVYEGRWLRAARRFVREHGDALARRDVWLFSSGPIGSDQIGIEHDQVAQLCKRSGARDHRLFPGRLDRRHLSRREQWIVDIVRAHDGDFRDWNEIEAWAAAICRELGDVRDRHVGKAAANSQ